MEQFDNLLPESFLCLVLQQFVPDLSDTKAIQAKLLRIVADRHRLARLRSTLSGTFRERFMDVALSDLSFAQMAVTIAEFKQYLLHDDILALALYSEEAAMEILADQELYEQLTKQELTTVLWHHTQTTRILLEVARSQQVILHPIVLSVAHSKDVVRDNLIANKNLLDEHEGLLEFVGG
jgi:hypothetical protein